MIESKKNLINALTCRLRYLTYDVPDEQFDEEEVNLIVGLLGFYEETLPDDYFTAEKAFERFLERPEVQKIINGQELFYY